MSEAFYGLFVTDTRPVLKDIWNLSPSGEGEQQKRRKRKTLTWVQISLANSVKVNCRLLNELTLDTSGWTFRDVTPGRSPFTLDSVSNGPELGKVTPGTQTLINGQNLPSYPRVSWVCEDKSGNIEASKVEVDATRMEIAADVLSAIASATYNGKPIEFTLRGNFCTARVKGTVAYTAPEHAALQNLRTSELDEAGDLSIADMVMLTFDKADPQSAKGHLVVNGTQQEGLITVSSTTSNVEWTWTRDELIGQEVSFKFRYQDGSETPVVTKTIREERE